MSTITAATPADIPALAELLNQAYRGDASRQGWTHEADLLQGTIRTDEAELARLIAAADGDILKCEDDTGALLGCVHLKKHGERLYLGMLSVRPTLQGQGIGKLFLKKAEEYALAKGCHTIFMQVITERTELNEWYFRHGYRPTGERKPFEVDSKYGVPVRPLEFMILEKRIGS